MKHIKTLGLCFVAALGLVALVASSASATWLVEGATVVEKEVTAEVHPLKNGEKHVVVLVPAKELEQLCEKVTTSGGKIYNGTLLLATLEFTKCKTFQKGKESPGCKPKEPIVTKIRAHLILHPASELTWLLVEPDLKNAKGEEIAPPGSKFTTIEYNEETCALPNSEIKGEIVHECLTEDLKTMEEALNKPDLCLSELVNHLTQEVPGAQRSLFGITAEKELKYGANPMFIDGILKWFLVEGGAATGKRWSGHV
jgi:hypothetical protein